MKIFCSNFKFSFFIFKFFQVQSLATIPLATIPFNKSESDRDPNSKILQQQREFSDPNFIRNAIGVTFDYESKRIYFSDISKSGSIGLVNFDGTKFEEILTGLGSVEGLAFDPLNGALYWASYTNASISRIHVNSRPPFATEKLLQLDSGSKPR